VTGGASSSEGKGFRTLLGSTNTESKANPETGSASLNDCDLLRISHSLDNRLAHGGKAGPTHRPRSTPQKHYVSSSGTHFC
jgi:hypothetical protein